MFSPPNVMWAVCRLQWCTIVKFCIVKRAIVEEVRCWSWCSGDDCAGVRMIEQCSRDTAGASRKLNFSTQLWFAHFQHSGHRWIMCSVMQCGVIEVTQESAATQCERDSWVFLSPKFSAGSILFWFSFTHCAVLNIHSCTFSGYNGLQGKLPWLVLHLEGREACARRFGWFF